MCRWLLAQYVRLQPFPQPSPMQRVRGGAVSTVIDYGTGSSAISLYTQATTGSVLYLIYTFIMVCCGSGETLRVVE